MSGCARSSSSAAYEVPSQLPPSVASQRTLLHTTPTVLAPATRMAVVSPFAVPSDEVHASTREETAWIPVGEAGPTATPSPPPPVAPPGGSCLGSSSTPVLVGMSGARTTQTPLSAVTLSATPHHHLQSNATFMSGYSLAPPAASSWGDVELGGMTPTDSPSSSTISSAHRLVHGATANQSSLAAPIPMTLQGFASPLTPLCLANASTPGSATARAATRDATPTSTAAHAALFHLVAPQGTPPMRPVAVASTEPANWVSAPVGHAAINGRAAVAAPAGLLPQSSEGGHTSGGWSTPSTPATNPSAGQRVVFVPVDVRLSGGTGGGVPAPSAQHDHSVALAASTTAAAAHHFHTTDTASGAPGHLALFPPTSLDSPCSLSTGHFMCATPTPVSAATAATTTTTTAPRVATPVSHFAYVPSLAGSPSPETRDVFVPVGASFPVTAVSSTSSVASRGHVATPLAAPGGTHTLVPCTAVADDDVVWCCICRCANSPAAPSDEDTEEDTTQPHTAAVNDGVREGSPMVRLACQHTFHANCIQRWLLRDSTCPMCRRDVTSTPSPATSYTSSHTR